MFFMNIYIQHIIKLVTKEWIMNNGKNTGKNSAHAIEKIMQLRQDTFE